MEDPSWGVPRKITAHIDSTRSLYSLWLIPVTYNYFPRQFMIDENSSFLLFADAAYLLEHQPTHRVGHEHDGYLVPNKSET